MKSKVEKKEYYAIKYPAGTVIELTSPINDPYTPKPAGSRFEIDSIDDMLQFHGRWLPPERGSMAVSIEDDNYKIVKLPEEI